MATLASTATPLRPTARTAPAPPAGMPAEGLDPAFGRSICLRQLEDHKALAWLVGILAIFLAVGLAGVGESSGIIPITLAGRAGQGAQEEPAQETTMAELQALAEAEEVVEETPEVVDVPPPVDMVPEVLDLPEIAEPLVTEDLFVIPTPPRIETSLRPVDPVEKPRPVVKRSAPVVARAATTARTTSAASTSTGGGGGGGTGATGSGGTGKFPKPPYPSFARSRGMQGTVSLAIRVGASGAVESVSVSRSTGFSDLDSYAQGFVQRNWRWPAGSSRSYTLPLTFNLR